MYACLITNLQHAVAGWQDNHSDLFLSLKSQYCWTWLQKQEELSKRLDVLVTTKPVIGYRKGSSSDSTGTASPIIADHKPQREVVLPPYGRQENRFRHAREFSTESNRSTGSELSEGGSPSGRSRVKPKLPPKPKSPLIEEHLAQRRKVRCNAAVWKKLTNNHITCLDAWLIWNGLWDSM